MLYNHDGALVYVGKSITKRGLDSRIRKEATGRGSWPITVDAIGFVDIVNYGPRFNFLACALEEYLISAFPDAKNKRGGSLIPILPELDN